MTFLEPGCGNGAFLIEAAKRILASKPANVSAKSLAPCLFGVEKNADLADQTRASLIDLMLQSGLAKATALKLAKAWVVCDDYLEMATERRFDFVVGNPPYVRQEAIPKELLSDYRDRFSCFYDRADCLRRLFRAQFGDALRTGNPCVHLPESLHEKQLRPKATQTNRRAIQAHACGGFAGGVPVQAGRTFLSGYLCRRSGNHHGGRACPLARCLHRRMRPGSMAVQGKREPASKETSPTIATRHGSPAKRNGPPIRRSTSPCCAALRPQAFRSATKRRAAESASASRPGRTMSTLSPKARSTSSRSCSSPC